MNLEYKHLLDPGFHPGSRVWIYQSSRLFSMSEALEIEDMLKTFTTDWQSHGVPVKGSGNLFFGQFVILMADETATGVSGCSTDNSVHLIKNIESRFGVSMFDRNNLAFVVNEKLQLLPLSQLQYAWDHHYIDGDTLYFNNLVQTKKELEEKWLIPLKESWLQNRIAVSNPQS